jgi:hypothetical protein
MEYEKNYILGFILVLISSIVNFILKIIVALNLIIMAWGSDGFKDIVWVLESLFFLLFIVQLLIPKFILQNKLGINIVGIVIFLILPMSFCISLNSVESIPDCELISVMQICVAKLIFDFDEVVELFRRKLRSIKNSFR